MKGIKLVATALVITSLLTSVNISYAAETDVIDTAVPSVSVGVDAEVPTAAATDNAFPTVSIDETEIDKIDLNVSQAEPSKAVIDQLESQISKVPEALLPQQTQITPDIVPVPVPVVPKTQWVRQIVEKTIDVPKTVLEEITVRSGSGTFGWDALDVDRYDSYYLPASFNINPYAGGIQSSVVYLENDGITDMVIYAEEFKSLSWDSPTVVNPNTFWDWKNLGINDTYSYIALGLSIKDMWGNELCQHWFDDEWNQESEAIYYLNPGEAVTIEIIGKHGMCWIYPCSFEYECVIGFEVVPKKVIEEKQIMVQDIIEVPVEIEIPIELLENPLLLKDFIYQHVEKILRTDRFELSKMSLISTP